MMRNVIGTMCFLLASVALAQNTTERLALRDYYALQSAAEPALSPDGTEVAFTRRTIDEASNERRSDVWIVPTDGSAPPRRVTTPGTSTSSPAFSPDGKLLTFRTSRDGASRVWFLRTDRVGEAFTIDGVGGDAWVSPDGRFVAFTKPTPPGEAKPELSSLEKELEERFDGEIYEWMQYRFDRRGYLPDPADPHASPPRELYVVALDGDEPKQLTSLGIDVADVAWRPDGGGLAFTADMSQRDEYVYERADVWLVDLDGKVERLTDDGHHHSSPAFSPDGARLAFRRVKGLTLLIEEKAKQGAPVDVYVMDLDSKSAVNVTPDWDLRPGRLSFGSNGDDVFFDAGTGGNRQLFRASVRTKTVSQVTRGDRWISGASFGHAAGKVAYASESAAAPSDIYVAAIDGSDERRLTAVGEAFAADKGLVSPERILFPSKDGTEIEGWVLRPRGYDGSQASPMILSIHGGPHGAYGNRFSFQFQYWASEGYVVLYTNPRGSSGYGESFLFATWGGGWGNLDTEDVLAGVDYVVEHNAIDESRLGVTGYSYGGFLSNWVLTHDTRFAAGIVGAGISNWVSDYGTADIPRTKESEFYGPPWEDEGGSLLRRQSPINYVQHAVTPTLFIHGESDYRVPIEQGEQMYTAFKKLRIPAKFIRYPGEYHGGWSPWNMVHRYHHELEWWDRYLSLVDSSQ